MTESTATTPEPYDFSTDPDNLTKSDVVPDDLILHLITSVLLSDDDSNSGTIAMTLTIGGSIVSGSVIGANEWLTGTSAQLVTGNETIGKAFTDSFNLIKQTMSQTKARREAEGRPTAAPNYVHMKDVTINPGPNQIGLPLWRATLSDISGWTLGRVDYKAS